jgi:hypothetical protein
MRHMKSVDRPMLVIYSIDNPTHLAVVVLFNTEASFQTVSILFYILQKKKKYLVKVQCISNTRVHTTHNIGRAIRTRIKQRYCLLGSKYVQHVCKENAG